MSESRDRGDDRPDYRTALALIDLPDGLSAYDARLVGTWPIGLALADSDLDIVCQARDLDAFARLLWARFSHWPDFALRQWTGGDRALIASFTAHGWPVEIFASSVPVDEQAGWVHFHVERRLLDLGGAALRQAIMALRNQGLKTEPAVAAALNLTGNPYAALIDLAEQDDAHLIALLAAVGFPAV